MLINTNSSTPIDGSEHLNYLLERLNSPGFTVGDMESLRDEPTVLQHIKSLYQVIMHNRACFVDEDLRELGFEELSFPRGRIKLFKTEDHTFSFTELSEYGLNAKSFSELYASIGVFEGLSVQDTAERMVFQEAIKLDIEALLFPDVRIDVIEICPDRDYDLEYNPLDRYGDLIISRETYKGNHSLSEIKGGYDINDLINGSRTQTKDEFWFRTLALNYSFIYYDDSWFDNDCLSQTEEAVKALTFIALESKLVSGKGFFKEISYNQEFERYCVSLDSGSLFSVRMRHPIPGTLVTIDTTDYNQLDRHFNRTSYLELLPEVDVAIKRNLSAFFKLEFNKKNRHLQDPLDIISGGYFFEPIIWNTEVEYYLKTDWIEGAIPIRDKPLN